MDQRMASVVMVEMQQRHFWRRARMELAQRRSSSEMKASWVHDQGRLNERKLGVRRVAADVPGSGSLRPWTIGDEVVRSIPSISRSSQLEGGFRIE